MKNFLLEQQQKEEKIAILTEFIKINPEARELKRAIAVKMALEGTPYFQITKLLGMHQSCITTWKQKFEAEKIDGIKLGYQGGKSYLTENQRQDTITWLQSKAYCSIEELLTYLDEQYGVIYKSNQSYYELMSAASISWKKSKKINPNAVPELVEKKREEIQDFFCRHQAEIQSGRLVVFFVDECHLLGGDVCGYVWGRTDIRIEIPIKNIKDRQTFFGALDYQTQEFIVRQYEAGNSENTVQFIKYLQSQRPGQRIVLIWDGAKYHNSNDFQDFLAEVNENYESTQWPITCIRFAPNAPEQNPVEDVWLQAKNLIRKFWPLCKTFGAVKWLFNFFTNHQQFDFPKLHQYAPCLELK